MKEMKIDVPTVPYLGTTVHTTFVSGGGLE